MVVKAVIHSGLMPDACVVVGLSVLACAYSIRVPTVQCIHTYSTAQHIRMGSAACGQSILTVAFGLLKVKAKC